MARKKQKRRTATRSAGTTTFVKRKKRKKLKRRSAVTNDIGRQLMNVSWPRGETKGGKAYGRSLMQLRGTLDFIATMHSELDQRLSQLEASGEIVFQERNKAKHH